MDEILNCVSRALRGVGGKMTATRAQKLVPKCLETCPEEPGFLQKHEPRSVRLIGVFHQAQKMAKHSTSMGWDKLQGSRMPSNSECWDLGLS